MLVDELKLKIKAGDGGDGVVRWLHLKGKEFSGPAGGKGGRGGDVYAVGARDIEKLAEYKHSPEFFAENGKAGQGKNKEGKDGKDLEIKFPVGSIITNKTNGDVFELLEVDERIKILSGGRGGWGNTHFKSSTNRQPKQAVPGQKTEPNDFFVELKLIADAGFIGLPNAGKTTLLNSLTEAHAKVGSYQFTTLEPNLGGLFGFVLADIPGLIEGASGGKGLGFKFLRHISRTKVFLHCISLENEDVVECYETVRKELEKFDKHLLKKKEIIVLTKSDMVTPVVIKDQQKKLKHFFKDIEVVTALDDTSIKQFSEFLVKELGKGKVVKKTK